MVSVIRTLATAQDPASPTAISNDVIIAGAKSMVTSNSALSAKAKEMAELLESCVADPAVLPEINTQAKALGRAVGQMVQIGTSIAQQSGNPAAGAAQVMAEARFCADAIGKLVSACAGAPTRPLYVDISAMCGQIRSSSSALVSAVAAGGAAAHAKTIGDTIRLSVKSVVSHCNTATQVVVSEKKKLLEAARALGEKAVTLEFVARQNDMSSLLSALDSVTLAAASLLRIIIMGDLVVIQQNLEFQVAHFVALLRYATVGLTTAQKRECLTLSRSLLSSLSSFSEKMNQADASVLHTAGDELYVNAKTLLAFGSSLLHSADTSSSSSSSHTPADPDTHTHPHPHTPAHTHTSPHSLSLVAPADSRAFLARAEMYGKVLKQWQAICAETMRELDPEKPQVGQSPVIEAVMTPRGSVSLGPVSPVASAAPSRAVSVGQGADGLYITPTAPNSNPGAAVSITLEARRVWISPTHSKLTDLLNTKIEMWKGSPSYSADAKFFGANGMGKLDAAHALTFAGLLELVLANGWVCVAATATPKQTYTFAPK
eukprot:TRINITY_DN6460_c0_g1_i1.p1 TRINITY_DN6460_c0_g1~~TRINITY_DN6460_c0_g1_i1.p1  ORF type:complete len:586 (-),score=139.31 TRINITY_DN6460_c0_g1_i1:315-1949(-)